MAVTECPRSSTSPRSTRPSPRSCPTASASSGATVGSPGPRSPTAPAGWPRVLADARPRHPRPARRPASRGTSPHDHVALYLHNGNEYLEGMLGASKARCASVNVNYRYVADELRYVLADSRARAVVYHGAFAPTLAEVARRPARPAAAAPGRRRSAARRCSPGALDYEAALAAADAARARAGCRPTTSTSSTPAARPACPRACCGARPTSSPPASASRRTTDAARRPRPAQSTLRVARRAAVHARRRPLERHQRVVRRRHRRDPGRPEPARPRRHPRTVAREARHVAAHRRRRVRPAAGRRAARGPPRRRPPALPAHRRRRPLGRGEGGAARAGARPPDRRRARLVGDRPPGRAARPTRHGARPRARSSRSPTASVLSEDLTRVLDAGRPRARLAGPDRARAPAATSATRTRRPRTFPDRRRRALRGRRRPGPRCSPTARVELHGRDSVTINTGGEKVFAEEVEQALKRHPAVFDAVVVGRPSERWGQEVVAVVQLRADAEPTFRRRPAGRGGARTSPATSSRRRSCGSRAIERSPSGKPDYRWAASGSWPSVAPGDAVAFRRPCGAPSRSRSPIDLGRSLGPAARRSARPHDPPRARTRSSAATPHARRSRHACAPSTTAIASRPRRGARAPSGRCDQAPRPARLPRRPRRLRPGRRRRPPPAPRRRRPPPPAHRPRASRRSSLPCSASGSPASRPAARTTSSSSAGASRPRAPAASCSHPLPEQIAELGYYELHVIGMERRRADTLKRVVRPRQPPRGGRHRRRAPRSASGSRPSPASGVWTSAEVARARPRRPRRRERRRLPPQAHRELRPGRRGARAPTPACSSCSSPTPATGAGCAACSRSAGVHAPAGAPAAASSPSPPASARSGSVVLEGDRVRGDVHRRLEAVLHDLAGHAARSVARSWVRHASHGP